MTEPTIPAVIAEMAKNPRWDYNEDPFKIMRELDAQLPAGWMAMMDMGGRQGAPIIARVRVHHGDPIINIVASKIRTPVIST